VWVLYNGKQHVYCMVHKHAIIANACVTGTWAYDVPILYIDK